MQSFLTCQKALFIPAHHDQVCLSSKHNYGNHSDAAGKKSDRPVLRPASRHRNTVEADFQSRRTSGSGPSFYALFRHRQKQCPANSRAIHVLPHQRDEPARRNSRNQRKDQARKQHLLRMEPFLMIRIIYVFRSFQPEDRQIGKQHPVRKTGERIIPPSLSAKESIFAACGHKKLQPRAI